MYVTRPGPQCSDASDIHQHKLTHREPIFTCYGCPREFRTYSGMIIHLESCACPSGIDINDLAESAAMCFQWSKFIIHEGIREALLEGQRMWSLTDIFGNPDKVDCFMCPECYEQFTKMSGLFMHVESPACSQTLDDGAIGKLRKWLFNRHWRRRSVHITSSPSLSYSLL
jgi:hypothetical protein